MKNKFFTRNFVPAAQSLQVMKGMVSNMDGTMEIIDERIACLVKNLGVLKVEKFIATMKREF